VKPRQNGFISMAIFIKFGANNDDRREVLGMAIGASEAET
jgi:transposase-like protein